MLPSTETPVDPSRDRAALIRELRDRYTRGTLDEILIPEDAACQRLWRDIAASTPDDVG